MTSEATVAGSAISIVIPAFDEEHYIGPTLDSLRSAIEYLWNRAGLEVEIIVVENGSTDRTAETARSRGAEVIEEARGNVATARNAGARAARGEILVFVDADTHWPESLLCRIVAVMSDRRCIGGAVDTDYRPVRFWVRAYLSFWRVVGKFFHMAQGATQFCRASAFLYLGGYDEALFMGEDVEFYWRLRRAARQRGSSVTFIDDMRVVPSCRRFDKWPFWKTVIWTNPLVVVLFSRTKKPWRDWYESPTR